MLLESVAIHRIWDVLNVNESDPLITDAPDKEEAKAVPMALDADPPQSTDEQAVGVGSRWSLAYNFGDLRLQVILDC